MQKFFLSGLKRFNKLNSIKWKITLGAGILIAIIFAILIFIVNYNTSNQQKNLEIINGKKTVENVAKDLNKDNARAVETIDLIAKMQTTGSFGKRQETTALLKSIMEESDLFVGAYIGYEPNGDGQDSIGKGKAESDINGRYLPYWNRISGTLVLDPLLETETSDYYMTPKNTLKTSIIEPFVYEGVLMTSYTAPIIINNQFKGISGVDRSLDAIKDSLRKYKPYQSAEFLLISPSGLIIAGPEDDMLGKNITENEKYNSSFEGILKTKETGIKEIKSPFNNEDSWLFYTPIPNGDWTLAMTVDIKEGLAGVKKINLFMLIISTIGLILLEVGLFIMVTIAVKPASRLVANANQISKGDLTVEINEQSKDEFGLIASSFKEMVYQVREMIGEIIKKSTLVGEVSMQLNLNSQQTTAGANETAASMNEIATTVEQVNENINEISSASISAAENANEGNISLNKLTGQMHNIANSSHESTKVVNGVSEKSQEIGKIVDIITTISDQTNLLALNAAIEAARAGEQGRGFAVVADEVRKLAEQSFNAAKEIKDLVGAIQFESQEAVQAMVNGGKDVEEGIQVVQEVGESFKQIINAVKGLTEQIQGVASATEQMSAGVQNIAAATEEQTAAIEEVSASAESLSTLAEELNNLTSKFKV
ncbi:MAG: methyl-accepting chemotaxis protein [Peptococcaceae bacterium]|nr:methyl-accepting chemotaxis protein [Peptococcaceae bacterium]